MTTLKQSGFSIGSFAEQLIMNEMTTPQKAKKFVTKTPEVEKQLDISETVVPEEFMSQVLGKKIQTKKPDVKPKQTIVENKQQVNLITEEKADKLITLLEDVKQLLEMTTGGCCGCSMSEPKVAEPSGRNKKSSDAVLIFAQKLKKFKGKK